MTLRDEATAWGTAVLAGIAAGQIRYALQSAGALSARTLLEAEKALEETRIVIDRLDGQPNTADIDSALDAVLNLRRILATLTDLPQN